MTINATDIKLLASERMTDTVDGGGRRTSNVIPDGVPGNIFSKVSRLDSVYGRVNLRKVYAHVDTENTDTYAGAHAAIIDAADNEKIKVNIFSTGSDFDDRSNARDRIESYVISGPESRLVMYGRQLPGQQAISCIQRIEEVLPEVGDVFCLSKETAGIVVYQQYVRVEDVDHEVRSFDDAQGTFDRRLITMKISATLRHEFLGWEQAERFGSTPRQSLVRSTTVADAARYFGIANLEEAALAESLEIKVDAILSNIVPTTQREAPVSLAQIGGASAVEPAGLTALPARQVASDIPGNLGGVQHSVTLNLGGAVARGSVQIHVREQGGANQGNASTDDGVGNFPTSAALPGFGYQIISGTIDYQSGVVEAKVTFANGGFLGSVWASYIPAADVSQPAHLMELPVTLATRGTVLVQTLNPLPARGTVFVDYRAFGKWYRLRDDGTGTLKGDAPAYGTGTVDLVTGSLVVTLGAIPDVGSSEIVGWASPAHYAIRAGATADAETKARQIIQFQSSGAFPINTASVTFSYLSGGVTYTAATNGSGVISGGGLTGKVDRFKGIAEIEYGTRLPDPGSLITIDYQNGVAANPVNPLHAEGQVNLVGAGKTFGVPTPVKSATLLVRLPVTVPEFAGFPPGAWTIDAYANADGDLITEASRYTFSSGPGLNWTHPGGDTVGSVDEGTGVVTLDDGAVITLRRAFYQFVTGGWNPAANYSVPIANGITMYWLDLDNAAAGSPDSSSPTFAVDDYPITLDLTKTTLASVVPGSIAFDAYGKSYFDRNGTIYHTLLADGSATPAGTVDYEAGVATLTDYNVATGAASISVKACLTRYGDFTAVKAVFRTAGSPVRPGSTFVQVTAADGDLLTATSDENGALTGAFARGSVDQTMGMVSIEWGEMVLAAGNEGEPWYDADDVVGDSIWKPREVMPSTIRYNTVVLSSLPVNADILGLDPVRLPSDGRVPILRPGDVILVHNTKLYALPNPAVASTTYNVGRTNLVDLTLVDNVGTKVPLAKYTVDLSAGTVTMAAGLDLTGLVQPLKARHRIEELNLATDVQLDGTISLAAPLSRDFDTDTRVSSCVLFGDLFARSTNIFDQVSWSNEWSDSRIGSDAGAAYNTIGFPIEASNAGAVTERWRISFTSTTAFSVVGENVGVIATGNTSTDCSPVNPLTGEPYFTLRSGGWGLGWSVGNQLRFNTVGATGSIWMVRTVMPGAALTGDSIDLQVRGDVDA